jgi:hypothetical protein
MTNSRIKIAAGLLVAVLSLLGASNASASTAHLCVSGQAAPGEKLTIIVVAAERARVVHHPLRSGRAPARFKLPC